MLVHVRSSIIVVFISILTGSFCEDSDNSWDVIVFSQHWPITVCQQWKQSKSSNNCTLPPKENLWTVHGIWPTKSGTDGPNFCNNSWHFDKTSLDPILPDLELYWTNVEANTPLYSFWKHEWVKHGTCAAEIPAFGGELKFFQQGLEWANRYGIGTILDKMKIEPKATGYTVEDIYDSIKNVTGKNARIECVIDKFTKLNLISEIRLCFDKNLTLINCDGLKSSESEGAREDINTNCDLKKSLMYYAKVPEVTGLKTDFDYKYHDRLYKLYNFIQYLIWFTL